ncbi:MAG: hypothetical protein ACYDG2_22610 [Ruminiclostridium sp.]
MPIKEFITPFRFFIGSSEQKNFSLSREDSIKLLDGLGVAFNKNDLANEDENKAFISQRAVNNAGLKPGDKIDKNVDVTIDKTFVSELPISVILTSIPANSYVYIIIPKPGKVAEMNQIYKIL